MQHPTTPNEVIAYWQDLTTKFDLTTKQGRYAATWDNPLAFALIYLSEILQNSKGEISFSSAHHEWCDQAREWMKPAATRDMYIAPRNLGKSTWWFRILPLWGAAFGHIHYLAAFSATASQAHTHLANFKRDLDNNAQLISDFPDLCKAKRRPNNKPVADNENRFIAANDFVFDADGIDSAVAGKNVGGKRPDVLLLDDVEEDEANYSLDKKNKRLKTILDNIFPLNVAARVVFVGTTTMADSIVHDLKRSLSEEPANWIRDLRPSFTVHYHAPITEDAKGVEHSIWPSYPEAFSLELMQSIRHTASYQKNYLNNPVSGTGDLWVPDTFKIGHPDDVTHYILSIDPAVTSKKSSDYTGLALVGLSLREKKVVVAEAWQVKKTPEELAAFVNDIVNNYPVSRLFCEVNQGGDLLANLFRDVDVPLTTKHQSVNKVLRASRVFHLYERGLVLHAKPLAKLEAQMMSFPNVANDDLVDAVGSGVLYFADAIKAKKQAVHRPGITSASYL